MPTRPLPSAGGGTGSLSTRRANEAHSKPGARHSASPWQGSRAFPAPPPREGDFLLWHPSIPYCGLWACCHVRRERGRKAQPLTVLHSRCAFADAPAPWRGLARGGLRTG